MGPWSLCMDWLIKCTRNNLTAGKCVLIGSFTGHWCYFDQ